MMTVLSINIAQSDMPGFTWIFILKSSETSDKKPDNASTEAFHFVDDEWVRYKY